MLFYKVFFLRIKKRKNTNNGKKKKKKKKIKKKKKKKKTAIVIKSISSIRKDPFSSIFYIFKYLIYCNFN